MKTAVAADVLCCAGRLQLGLRDFGCRRYVWYARGFSRAWVAWMCCAGACMWWCRGVNSRVC